VQANLIACPECDLLQQEVEIPCLGTARCSRCGVALYRNPKDGLNRTLALTVAAAIVFIVANVVPLMGLSAVGRETSTTILGGVQEMWRQGREVTAVIVGFCAVIAPALDIGFMLTILLAVRLPPAPRWAGALMRWSQIVRPWRMVEVMILGILVALIKIAELATVIPDIGMFAVGVLVVLLTAMMVSFEPRDVWARVQWAAKAAPGRVASREAAGARAGTMTSDTLTAAQAGLVSCEVCGLLSWPADPDEPGHCPRCGEALIFRRHNAIQRTWALIIAAVICYIPANLFPVLTTITPVSVDQDTIMDGVILLYTSGSWPLALIVLIASVIIPLAKLIALAYLLITVQRRSLKSRHERGRLYRMVEFIGRWSMLDVFVDTFVVALVRLAPLMAVEPGPGVPFFGMMVVLTMLAADSFDPRLIWDTSDDSREQHG